jgi:hypothetical protein
MFKEGHRYLVMERYQKNPKEIKVIEISIDDKWIKYETSGVSSNNPLLWQTVDSLTVVSELKQAPPSVESKWDKLYLWAKTEGYISTATRMEEMDNETKTTDS